LIWTQRITYVSQLVDSTTTVNTKKVNEISHCSDSFIFHLKHKVSVLGCER